MTTQDQREEEKKVLEMLVTASEEFLQYSGSEPDYQKITDNILYISGAKYAAFNLYNEDGSKYTTMALSGSRAIINKVISLVGYQLHGKVWEFDPVRAEKMKLLPTTYVSTVSQYVKDFVARPAGAVLEKTLNMGEVALVKILKENTMIGYFTLVLPKNVRLKNENYIEIYTRQLGLLITRSRSEAKLIKSETRFRSVFAAVSDSIFLIDQKTGSILDVNDAACRLYGYTRDEMLELKNTDLSAEPQETRKAMQEFKTSIPLRYHKKKDGTVFPAEISLNIFELEGKKVYTASIRDITERIKSDEILQASEKKYRNLFIEMIDGYALHDIICDREGNAVDYITLEVNKSFELLLDASASLTVNKKASEILPQQELKHWLGIFGPVALTGKSAFYEMYSPLNHKFFEGVAYCPEKGKFAVTFRDITNRKKAEEELIRSNERLAFAQKSANAGIWDWDINTGELNWSPEFYILFGLDPKKDSANFDTWRRALHPEDRQSAEEYINKSIKDGKSLSNNYRIIKPSGDIIWISALGNTLYDEQGTALRMSGICIDITELKKVQETLHISEEKFAKAFHSSPQGISITSLDDNKLIEVNSTYTDILGYSREEVIGRSAVDIGIWVSPQERIKFAEILKKEGFLRNREFEGRTKNRGIITLLFSVDLIDLSGRACILTTFYDISERKRAEEQILYLSYHDQLTDLYNRRFFEEELKRLDTDRQLPLSIIMGDLNGLKIINDIFGHSEGDRLLVETTEILKKACRSEDILARWGGDEFVMLLPKTSITDTEVIVQRIRKECKKTGTQKIPISLSLGSATKQTASNEIKSILIDAESNMYKNKLAQKESLASSIIFALDTALYEKSNETKEHTDRIKGLAVKLGRSINLSASQLDELSLLASLHDIGKVAIPEKILLKKGKLTKKEWTIIKRHPEIGFNIAQSSPQIAHIAKPILSCHENWDGSGYPLGIKGAAIPVISRIILIVDAFDVMTTGRIYKPAMSKEDAIAELKRCAGTQFDPELVDKFIEILSK